MSPVAQRLAPDPALPARDELLDPDAMAARFAQLLGERGAVHVEGCRREWARYEPGHKLQAVYRARIDGDERLISAHAFADERQAAVALDRAAATAVAVSPLRPFAGDGALNSVYWTFPNDRKIVALREIAQPSRTLDAMVGLPVEPHIVAYAPGRAATACCVDADGETVAYAKAFGGAGAFEHAVHVSGELAAQVAATGSDLRLPRVLAHSAAPRLVVFEALSGTRVLDAETAEATMARLGGALARFHGLRPPGGLPARSIGAETLRQAVERVAWGDPASARRAGELAAELLSRRPHDEPPVCLHGDLNVRNVILDGDRTALIDLDDVAVGPAGADLGRTLAGLASRRQIGEIDRAEEERLGRAMLDGYAAVSPLPHVDAVRWHAAATLLVNRARAAVLWVNPNWARRLATVLDDVREVLG